MSDVAQAALASGVDATVAEAGYVKLLVRLAPGTAAEATSGAAAVQDLAANFVVPSEEQAESLSLVAARALGRRGRRPAPPPMRYYPHLGLALGYADASGVAALRQDSRVATMAQAPELSLIRPVTVRAAARTGAPKVTWGLTRLRVPEAWAAGFHGTGVLVGHLDTGVDGEHPAFAGGAIAHYALVDRAGNLVPGAKPEDSDEHGTHTAGTILGRPVRGTAFGVAPGARLVSAQVIEGGQVIDRVLAGMDWALSKRIHVLSLSLGLRGFTPAFQVLIDALRAGGVLPVVAVGNEGPNASRSPGNYDSVLSVGAMDEDDAVADFSGSMRFNRPDDPLVPDLVAPGVSIRSALPGGGFGVMDGSSMATPHVAGLAALLFQARPGATVAAVEAAILASCERPNSMSRGRANRGVPDAIRAIEALTGAPVVPAAVHMAVAASRPGRARAPAAATRDLAASKGRATARGKAVSRGTASKPRTTAGKAGTTKSRTATPRRAAASGQKRPRG